MTDENENIDMIEDNDHERNHPFAIGILAGTAVGVGLGLLVAPRAGAETRKQCREQANHFGSLASNGYHHAKDTAEDLAHRSRHAYDNTREFLTHGAHETQRYVRDVADAVTMKSRRLSEEATNRVQAISSHASADQPTSGRDRTSDPRDKHTDRKAV